MLQRIEKPTFMVVKDPKYHGEFMNLVYNSYFLRAPVTDQFISEHNVFLDTQQILANLTRLEINEDEYIYANENEMAHLGNMMGPFCFDIMAVLDQNRLSYFSEELNRYKNTPWKEVW